MPDPDPRGGLDAKRTAGRRVRNPREERVQGHSALSLSMANSFSSPRGSSLFPQARSPPGRGGLWHSAAPGNGRAHRVPVAGWERSIPLRRGREGSGGHSGETLSAVGRSAQAKTRSHDTTADTTRRKNGVPAPGGPWVREEPEDEPTDAAGKAPTCGAATLRSQGPSSRAPPPHARSSRAATVTRRGYTRTRAHTRRDCDLEPAALLSELGLATAASPAPPYLRSTVGGERKCGSAPGHPTHGRGERRPRPQRAFAVRRPRPRRACPVLVRRGVGRHKTGVISGSSAGLHGLPASRPRGPRRRALEQFPACQADSSGASARRAAGRCRRGVSAARAQHFPDVSIPR